MSADVATLIIRALSGLHLHDFLPGDDNKAAIRRAVSSKASWTSPGTGWGQVVREGIGEWPAEVGLRDRRPTAATLFVSWPEVLARIAQGCAGGHRQRYEAAYTAWSAANREAWKDYKPDHPGPFPWVDQTRIQEAQDALIRHGCEDVMVQGSLFDAETLSG